jgi:phosphotransferase system enzyme I (PtsI)
VARALVLQHEEVPIFRIPIARQEVDAECARVEAAKRLTRRQLEEMKGRTVARLGEEHGYIYDAQILMLDDPLLIDRVLDVLRKERVNAEWALQATLGELAAIFDTLKDDYLRERKGDIFDVAGRLLSNLTGGHQRPQGKLERDYVLVSDIVRPSDPSQLDWEHIAGLAMEGGSRTYHTAIIARSLGIPCVVGVHNLMIHVDAEAALVLDGNEGLVIVHPDRQMLRDYRSKRRKYRTLERKWKRSLDLPAETRDGHRVSIQANIDSPEECADAVNQSADGIGLFRSEWLLNQLGGRFPEEDEQYDVYRGLAEQMKPLPVIVRTFDVTLEPTLWGGAGGEANPAMGLRATRLLLRDDRYRGLFKAQLRALLRARSLGNVKVMFPMISGVDELREARSVLEEAKEELRAAGEDFSPDLPAGVTLEVPSAASTADLLARHADFFSIGSNDLIQYFLAVDRGNETVSYLYEPLHPAMLRTIRFVVDAAHQAGIPVGMCGEIAADPLLVVILVGFGLDELSMNALAIGSVKDIIRKLSLEEAREIAGQALELATAEEIASFVRERMAKRVPKGLYW